MPVAEHTAHKTPSEPHATEGIRRRRQPAPSKPEHESQVKADSEIKQRISPGPRFATVNLPPQYDHLPYEIRLWLASRLSPDLEHEFLSPGSDRAITWQNTLVLLDMLWITVPAMWSWFLKNPTGMLPVVLLLCSRVVEGLSAAGRLWGNSKLLGLVEACLKGEKVDVADTWRVGLMAVILISLPDVVNQSTHYGDRLSPRLRNALSGAFLRAKLSSTITEASDPVHGSLLLEGGLFCAHIPEGFTFLIDRLRTASDLQQLLGDFLNSTISLLSQLVLLAQVLGQGDNLFSFTNLMILVFAFAPLAPRLFQPNVNYFDSYFYGASYRAAQNYKIIGYEFSYKPEIILFSLKDWILKRWSEAETREMKEYKGEPGSIFSTAESIFTATVNVAFHLVLATRSGGTSLTLSTLNLYQQAAVGVTNSFRRLRECLTGLYTSLFIACAFHIAVLERPKPKRADYESNRYANGMRIVAENLSFAYPGSDGPVLHDINLTIEPGQTLAIVGFNGGGKSTLIKVLLGLYDDHAGLKGVHLINGHPPSYYDPETLYARTSCVLQDYSKYNLSIRDNVGVGDTGVSDDNAIRSAMELGGAAAILEENGFDTILKASRSFEEEDEDDEDQGELAHLTKGAVRNESEEARMSSEHAASKKKSTGLSGGQWQRIALSRAFMRAEKADLVVFDEPSASLDPRAEAELFGRIHGLAGGCTTVYVSHRFSTVRRADRIAFVDGGTIIEYGTHKELMELGGKYCELFTLQRSGFDE